MASSSQHTSCTTPRPDSHTVPCTRPVLWLLQDGNLHHSKSDAPTQPHPDAVQSPSSAAGTPRAVAALPPKPALPAAATSPGISHAPESGSAGESVQPRLVEGSATEHADADVDADVGDNGTQGKGHDEVVVTLLRLDIPATSREGRCALHNHVCCCTHRPAALA